MANMNLYSRNDKLFVYVNIALIVIFTLSTLYPFIYIAAVSFSDGSAASAGVVVYRPIETTIAAYRYVMEEPLFWTSYRNTFIYTFGGTFVSLLIIVPGAYALSRPQLIGRRFFNLFVAFTMWFNAGLIPFFLNMRDLGLMDSYFGLIIAFACNAFNIILLRNFFEAIPQSFEEAARMDGANEFQVLWKVYIPLSKPALATIILFCMVARWNGFFWAMILLKDEDKIPLQVYLRQVIATLKDDEEFGLQVMNFSYSVESVTAAIMVCSIIPVLIFYPFIQKYFNKGIMLGGVKE
ncbi:MAG: carbohydrate ABC transporter permease [Yoonia sp.]|jgi:putative aldouronate transport system permease protein